MTVRPIGALVVAAVSAGCLLAMLVVVVVALPPDVRGAFTLFQDVTMAIFLAGVLAALFGVARTRVSTDDDGIHVLNGYRRHDLSWAEAVQVNLGRGAPWAVLDTSDGTTVQLMAIQRADGQRAVAAVRALRDQLARHSPRDP
jgi:Bacterial PH domain